MRVAPRHGLDDTGDFDRLVRIEDTGLAVMRVSEVAGHGETQDNAHDPDELAHIVTSCCYAGILSREMPFALGRHSADRRRARAHAEGPRSQRTGRARFDRNRLHRRLFWTVRARRVLLRSPR